MSSSASLMGGGEYEDCDFNDVVLNYISSVLMDEDIDAAALSFQGTLALQAAEKSLYEVIGEEYPPSRENAAAITSADPILQSLGETGAVRCRDGLSYDCNGSRSSRGIADIFGVNCPFSNYDSSGVPYYRNTYQQASISSSNSGGTSNDVYVDSPVSTLTIPNLLNGRTGVLHLKEEGQEARELYSGDSLIFVDPGDEVSVLKGQIVEAKPVRVEVEESYGDVCFNDGLKGKKNRCCQNESREEERRSKQSAVYAETTVRSEMFDKVLLCDASKCESELREAFQNEASKSIQQNVQVRRRSNSGKGHGKKKGDRKDVVDLRTLLTLCAQAVAANDQRTAYDLLKQIRQHSSPVGDGMQRVAHYLVNGLEARLAGSGTKIYASLVALETSAADFLKAYHLFLAVCPFKKIANFFSNKTIMNVTENATSLHIIDFGILYGFQWPCLIQRLSHSRGGRPLKLRITGIDFPLPGFRPSKRVEETGHRLRNYAETFNVPFEFNGLAQKWETIQIEDLKIKDDEVLVVNNLFRFRYLLDETVMVESPRNTVLNMIRKLNPDVYIQGAVNGAYSAPFFLTRFREALFHFSTMFDMLDANVPREVEERMLLEKEVFGREAINVIASEGSERRERPETYKQWQVRNVRAGFLQLPLDREISMISKDRVKTHYHKDFLIDKDGEWMLMGWKGRITYALSSWRPAH